MFRIKIVQISQKIKPEKISNSKKFKIKMFKLKIVQIQKKSKIKKFQKKPFAKTKNERKETSKTREKPKQTEKTKEEKQRKMPTMLHLCAQAYGIWLRDFVEKSQEDHGPIITDRKKSEPTR
jgi:hypothetical protein